MPEPIVICDNLVKSIRLLIWNSGAARSGPGSRAGRDDGHRWSIRFRKSTLLNILSGLDVPSAGRGIVDGNDLTHLTEAQRIVYRRYVVGHNLAAERPI